MSIDWLIDCIVLLDNRWLVKATGIIKPNKSEIDNIQNQNIFQIQTENQIETQNEKNDEVYLLSKANGFNFYNKLVTLNELKNMKFD